MRAARIVVATLLAPCIAALPYFAFGVYAFASSGGGPPAQGVLVCIVLVILAAAVGAVVLGICRITWKMKKMVPRRQLFGFPVTFAILFFLLLGVLAALSRDWRMCLAVIAASVTAAFVGIAAAKSWLVYAYPDDDQT